LSSVWHWRASVTPRSNRVSASSSETSPLSSDSTSASSSATDDSNCARRGVSVSLSGAVPASVFRAMTACACWGELAGCSLPASARAVRAFLPGSTGWLNVPRNRRGSSNGTKGPWSGVLPNLHPCVLRGPRHDWRPCARVQRIEQSGRTRRLLTQNGSMTL